MYSDGKNGTMQIGTFFENAAKCVDTEKVCRSEEIKGDLPVNTTTNMTFGFESLADLSSKDILLPKNYFCY